MATVEDTGAEPTVVRLSDLVDGMEALTFAALVRKVRGTTYKGETFLKCYFRDRFKTLEAPLWANSRLLRQAETWVDGAAYRLHVRASQTPRYGLQLEILSIRPTGEADADEGFNFYDLVESTERDPEVMLKAIRDSIEKYVDDPRLRQLVLSLLDENLDLFKKLQAAQNFHHSYTGGLLEHVWSMTRLASFAAEHYGRYYAQLDPPLNKGVIVAATVLHDIGKLRELGYHPVEAKYTKEGCLIGHVLMGRDMVREAARRIDGFDEETLILLEHAILAHHGKREFGAPIVPQTLEALLVSYIDDLDAKMNIAARERLRCDTEGDFTGKVYALDNRRLYKGLRASAPDDGPESP